MIWSTTDEAVFKEREMVSDYGIDRLNDRVGRPSSYKAQALREMATRLVCLEKIKELEAEIGRLTDILDKNDIQYNL